MSKIGQNLIFLNHYDNTDIDTKNYTPGRFLMTLKAPSSKLRSKRYSSSQKRVRKRKGKNLPEIKRKKKTLNNLKQEREKFDAEEINNSPYAISQSSFNKKYSNRYNYFSNDFLSGAGGQNLRSMEKNSEMKEEYNSMIEKLDKIYQVKFFR